MKRALLIVMIPYFLLAPTAFAEEGRADTELERLRKELQETKRQMEEQHKASDERIKKLEDIVNRLTSEKQPAPPAQPKKDEGKAALEREVEEFLKQSGGGKKVAQAQAPGAAAGNLPEKLSLGPGGLGQVFNPGISAIGDVLFHNNSSGHDADLGDGKFLFRELELAFSQVVDPFARADAFISIGEDPHNLGNFEIEIEEAYMTLLTLPYDLQAKVGRFRAGVGKANLMHLHALPWVDYPIMVKNLLGEDGLIGDGLSASWLVPNPWKKYFELSYEIFNNDSDTLFVGTNPKTGLRQPANSVAQLAHLKTFWDLTRNTSLEVGGTALAAPNTANDSRWAAAEGADMTLKWQHPKLGLYKALTWQTEALLLQRSADTGKTVSTWGMYSSLEYQFARRWKAAARYDFAQLPDLSDYHENAASLYVTFLQSEFAFWRLGYMFRDRDFIPAGGEGDRDEHTVFLQLNVGIGPHRAHKY